jgi:hypothetical protein
VDKYTGFKCVIKEKIAAYQSILDMLPFKAPVQICYPDPYGSWKDLPDIIAESRRNIVYIFRAPVFSFSYETIANKFADLNRDNKKERSGNCMCAINEDFWTEGSDVALYVGSCRDHIKSRMQAHIGGLSSTYGLHLSLWWKDEAISELAPFSIDVYSFGDIQGEQLQIIEDAFWETCRPLFGRKGAK